MRYIRNTWYVAALSDQLGDGLMRRSIVDRPILFYREPDGRPAAMLDRCPHRFAPLSLGRKVGAAVECLYHGLQFDRTGRCVLNPHDSRTDHISVRSFPVVERHGMIWVWTGEQDRADPDLITDLSDTELSERSRTIYSYSESACRADLLVDNLLDLSHVDFLHVGSFSTGTFERTETKVRQDGDDALIHFIQHNGPPAPQETMEQSLSLPDALRSGSTRVDVHFNIRWRPNQVISFERRIVPTGCETDDAAVTRFSHICTPATATSTHYFASISDNRSVANEEEVLREYVRFQRQVVDTEDVPMLEAIGYEMAGAELLEMHPVILPTDRAALHVRRIMRKLIAAEQTGESSSTFTEAFA